MPRPKRAETADLNTQFRAVEAGEAVVIPVPEGRDARVRLAATLVAQGVVGTEVGAHIAGMRAVADFLAALGKLKIVDVFTDQTAVENDLEAARLL